MSQLSLDLGYWRQTPDGGGRLTADGKRFVAEVFK